jgi:UDP-glucuronate 4-epimerase
MRFLVTGSAGFIGFHLCRRLIALGHTVDGLDGMTDYYDPALKRARHAALANTNLFRAHEVMLEDMDALTLALAEARPDIVVHLAAQAGVRYSIEEPRSYLSANVLGTFNLLEALRKRPVTHLMLASTSSVYGANAMPFTEADPTDHPLSFYAATKKATEAMAHSYAHLFTQPTTVMRFFTVYGPWGRPDMALFKFTRSILAGEPIDVFNGGRMQRDFTFVDDAVEAMIRLVDLVPGGRTGERDAAASPAAPYRVVNIAGGTPVELDAYIQAIEIATGHMAIRNELPMPAGEPQATLADTRELERLTGFRPRTPVVTGVRAFVDWYREFYKV